MKPENSFLSIVFLVATAMFMISFASAGYGFYVDSNTGTIHRLSPDGTTTDFGVSASLIGNPANLDSDNLLEVPYIDSSGNLKIADKNGEVQTLDSGLSTSKVVLSSGTWKGSTTYVFYPDSSDNSYIKRNRANFAEETVLGGIAANGVLGTGDFNGDGDKDLVFTGTSDTISYIDGGSTISTGFSSFGSNNNKGIGPAKDFDKDGQIRVPVVDGSGNLALVDYNGNSNTLNNNYGSAIKTKVGGVDLAGDSRKEVIHLNSDNTQVAYQFLNGTTHVYSPQAGGTPGVSGGSLGNSPPYKPTLNAPEPNQTKISDSTPTFNVTVKDPDGDSLNTTFYWSDGTIIGEDLNVANGSFANYTTSSEISDGQHFWYANVSDGSVKNQSDIWTFTVDTSPPKFSNVGDNSSGVVGGGKIVSIQSYWQDTTSDLDTAEFYHNASGPMTQMDTKTFSTTGGAWFNGTIDTSGHQGETICWKQNASDTKGNWNDSMGDSDNCFRVAKEVAKTSSQDLTFDQVDDRSSDLWKTMPTGLAFKSSSPSLLDIERSFSDPLSFMRSDSGEKQVFSLFPSSFDLLSYRRGVVSADRIADYILGTDTRVEIKRYFGRLITPVYAFDDSGLRKTDVARYHYENFSNSFGYNYENGLYRLTSGEFITASSIFYDLGAEYFKEIFYSISVSGSVSGEFTKQDSVELHDIFSLRNTENGVLKTERSDSVGIVVGTGLSTGQQVFRSVSQTLDVGFDLSEFIEWIKKWLNDEEEDQTSEDTDETDTDSSSSSSISIGEEQNTEDKKEEEVNEDPVKNDSEDLKEVDASLRDDLSGKSVLIQDELDEVEKSQKIGIDLTSGKDTEIDETEVEYIKLERIEFSSEESKTEPVIQVQASDKIEEFNLSMEENKTVYEATNVSTNFSTENASLVYTVKKKFIRERNATKEDIVVERWKTSKNNTLQEKLPTRVTDENSTFYTVRAYSSEGFSVFVVTLDKSEEEGTSRPQEKPQKDRLEIPALPIVNILEVFLLLATLYLLRRPVSGRLLTLDLWLSYFVQVLNYRWIKIYGSLLWRETSKTGEKEYELVQEVNSLENKKEVLEFRKNKLEQEVERKEKVKRKYEIQIAKLAKKIDEWNKRIRD